MKWLLVPMLLLQGCVSITTPHVTGLNYDPSIMKIAAKVSGESSQAYVLGCIPFGYHPTSNWITSAEAATQNALDTAGADVILNPTVDVQNYFIFFGVVRFETIRVSGLAAHLRPKPEIIKPAE